MTPERRAEAWRLYQQPGSSLVRVADELGVDPMTVRRWLMRDGHPMRASGRPPLVLDDGRIVALYVEGWTVQGPQRREGSQTAVHNTAEQRSPSAGGSATRLILKTI